MAKVGWRKLAVMVYIATLAVAFDLTDVQAKVLIFVAGTFGGANVIEWISNARFGARSNGGGGSSGRTPGLPKQESAGAGN